MLTIRAYLLVDYQVNAEATPDSIPPAHGTRPDWLWMTLMMLVWLVVLGGIVYAAVRLALQHQHQQKPPLQQ